MGSRPGANGGGGTGDGGGGSGGAFGGASSTVLMLVLGLGACAAFTAIVCFPQAAEKSTGFGPWHFNADGAADGTNNPRGSSHGGGGGGGGVELSPCDVGSPLHAVGDEVAAHTSAATHPTSARTVAPTTSSPSFKEPSRAVAWNWRLPWVKAQAPCERIHPPLAADGAAVGVLAQLVSPLHAKAASTEAASEAVTAPSPGSKLRQPPPVVALPGSKLRPPPPVASASPPALPSLTEMSQLPVGASPQRGAGRWYVGDSAEGSWEPSASYV